MGGTSVAFSPLVSCEITRPKVELATTTLDLLHDFGDISLSPDERGEPQGAEHEMIKRGMTGKSGVGFRGLNGYVAFESAKQGLLLQAVPLLVAWHRPLSLTQSNGGLRTIHPAIPSNCEHTLTKFPLIKEEPIFSLP